LRYLVEAGDLDPSDSTIQKISRAFGIGTGDVKSIISRSNLLERLQEAMKNSKIDDKKALEMYSNGMSDYEIAKEFNVTGQTIFYWRKRMKLETKHDTHETKKNKTNKKDQPQVPGQGYRPKETETPPGPPPNIVSAVQEPKQPRSPSNELEMYKRTIRELQVENANLKGYMAGVKDTLDAIRKSCCNKQQGVQA